jgi:hypothetical protein
MRIQPMRRRSRSLHLGIPRVSGFIRQTERSKPFGIDPKSKLFILVFPHRLRPIPCALLFQRGRCRPSLGIFQSCCHWYLLDQRVWSRMRIIITPLALDALRTMRHARKKEPRELANQTQGFEPRAWSTAN